MTNEKIINTIKDLIVAFFASVLLMTGSLKISMVFMFFIPIPFIIVGIRNGKYMGIVGVGLFSLLIAMFANIELAIGLLVVFTPLTYTIQYLVTKKEKMGNIIFISGLILLVSMVLVLTIEASITGIDIKSQMEDSFEIILDSQMETLEELDISKYKMKDLESGLKAAYKATLTLIPTLLIIGSYILAYLNYKISTYIANKMGYRNLKVPQFSEISLPSNFLLGSAVMFISTIIAGKMELPYHNALTVNVGALISILYLLQGITVIAYFLKRARFNKFFRFLIISVLTSIAPLGGLILILGFVDSIFDIRKIREEAS